MIIVDLSSKSLMCLTFYTQVTRRNLVEVLTTKKTKTKNEQFIVPYKYEEVSCVYFSFSVN